MSAGFRVTRLIHLPGLLLRQALIGLIVGYQRWISPLSGPSCKYYPTCSAYGRGAIEVHGALKGLTLTIARILRCNPFSGGGVNRIPLKGHWRAPSDTRGNVRPLTCAHEHDLPRAVSRRDSDRSTIDRAA